MQVTKSKSLSLSLKDKAHHLLLAQQQFNFYTAKKILQFHYKIIVRVVTAIVRSPGPQNKVEAQSLLLTTENTIASTQSCFDVSFFCDEKSELVHFGLPSNSTA